MQQPYNATTERPYTRGNVARLQAAQAAAGYPTAAWATYRQWLTAGAQVRAGEHGTGIIYGGRRTVVDKDGTERDAPIRKAFTVFNAAQVDAAEVTTPAAVATATAAAAELAAVARDARPKPATPQVPAMAGTATILDPRTRRARPSARRSASGGTRPQPAAPDLGAGTF